MRRQIEKRRIEFRGTPGGAPERQVTLADGRRYTHRCSPQTFEKVAAYLDEHSAQNLKMQSLADAIEAPMTQVNVALQLLGERGLIVTDGRVVSIREGYRTAFHEHAMTEFYALIEGCPPEYGEA